MAPKWAAPLDVPPVASSEEDEVTSSDEEEEDGSEGEGSSSSEEGKSKNPPKTKVFSSSPLQTQTAKADVKKSNPVAEQVDESESETETETESDSNDSPSANANPIASRPMEETQTKTGKPTSKPSVSTVAPGKSTVKRGNEVDQSDAKDSKRAKRDSESNGVNEKSEDANKKLFQRLWTEDDEIVWRLKKSFCDFIKKSLTFSLVLSQLKDKVWRLKKRFEKHSSKGKSGEDKTFSKTLDQKLFYLSKRIWGKERICNDNSSRAKKQAALKADLGIKSTDESEKTDKKEVETENHFGLKGITRFDKRVDVLDYVMKKGMDMLEGAQKAEMEEKWRDLNVAELELFLKRNELLKEQAELMLARL